MMRRMEVLLSTVPLNSAVGAQHRSRKLSGPRLTSPQMPTP
jgi:hypothetical protein